MKKASLAVAAMVAVLGAGSLASASDHTDGTTAAGGALNDPSVDITDVYSWMSSDSTTVNLVMNVFPGATATSAFSTAAKYVIHTTSQASYGAATVVKRDIICTFAGTPQIVSCWITNPANANSVVDYITGNAATAASPAASADGKIKAFTGLRNDPFFFNLAGFRNASATVAAAIKADGGGADHTYINGFDTTYTNCPVLTTLARTTVVDRLSADCTGVAATTPSDFFRKPDANATPAACTTAPMLVHTPTVNEGTTGNILAIVLTVDKTLLTSGGPIMGVWGATTK